MSRPGRAASGSKRRSTEADKTEDLVYTESDSHFDLLGSAPPDLSEAFNRAARIRRVQPGSIIYRQGDLAASMFRIVSGSVRLSAMLADGRELLYVIFTPGACFGYSSLIDGKGMPHTAEAQGVVELQVLSAASFHALRRQFRELDEALLTALCSYMRILSAYVFDASLEELPQRLARRLLAVAGKAKGHGGLIVNMPQNELALFLGVSRQAVNRLLKQFQDRQLVRLHYGEVVIENAPGLRALAETGYAEMFET